MTNITTMTNPLMQPVQYNAQTYFTGQYFHQMYRNNSDTHGKYKRAGDFVRLIRSIEAYQDYIDARDIVELSKDEADASLASAFKATYGKPIMLINATAQIALTHHLDDEVSKSASMCINQQAATNQKTMTALQQARAAKALLDTFIHAGKVLGTDPAMAKAIGVSQVQKTIGLDLSQLLIGNTVEEKPMTPTDIGKKMGISGQKVNKLLEEAEMQEKDDRNDWMPTEKGKAFCTLNPYKAPNSDHTGYRVLWYPSAIEELDHAA